MIVIVGGDNSDNDLRDVDTHIATITLFLLLLFFSF